MREEYTLALRRESYELERELVDRRIDDAFERVYEYLDPAAAYLRQVCDDEGRRALQQLERAYLQALEVAARSGLGCRPARKEDSILRRRPTIAPATGVAPAASESEATRPATTAENDRVILVQPAR